MKVPPFGFKVLSGPIRVEDIVRHPQRISRGSVWSLLKGLLYWNDLERAYGGGGVTVPVIGAATISSTLNVVNRETEWKPRALNDREKRP